MRIGVLTSGDSRRRVVASGTPYYMARALERSGADVVHLGPVRAVRASLGRLRSGLSRALTGRRRAYHHTLPLAREYARHFAGRIPAELDVILAPFASTEIALLETDVPIVYTSDATLPRMRDYNPGFTGLDPEYYTEAAEVERRALERARVLLYPTEWAAASAVEDHGAPPRKVHVVPYGANLEPDAIPSAGALEAGKPDGGCRLLFLGVDWEWKGGPVALELVYRLRERGVGAELVVCGCEPPEPIDADFVTVVPRLDKADPEARRALSRLLLGAHFLVLPTLAECYGLVFCEASAHGTPSLAPDTGGVGGAISHGENGFLVPEGSGAEAYADRIVELLADRDRYCALVRSSRRAWEERLNWDRWAERVLELAAGAIA